MIIGSGKDPHLEMHRSMLSLVGINHSLKHSVPLLHLKNKIC